MPKDLVLSLSTNRAHCFKTILSVVSNSLRPLKAVYLLKQKIEYVFITPYRVVREVSTPRKSRKCEVQLEMNYPRKKQGIDR